MKALPYLFGQDASRLQAMEETDERVLMWRQRLLLLYLLDPIVNAA
jgi:hypothetical protein